LIIPIFTVYSNKVGIKFSKNLAHNHKQASLTIQVGESNNLAMHKLQALSLYYQHHQLPLVELQLFVDNRLKFMYNHSHQDYTIQLNETTHLIKQDHLMLLKIGLESDYITLISIKSPLHINS